MQFYLQNLRQLRIDWGHWSRCRALDGSASIVEGNCKRAPEPCIVVQCGPGRILPNRLRTFEHLLGCGEVGDQLVRRVGMLSVRVDRQLRPAERGSRMTSW